MEHFVIYVFVNAHIIAIIFHYNFLLLTVLIYEVVYCKSSANPVL